MPDNYYSEVNENGVVTPLRDLAAFPRSEQAVLGAKQLLTPNLSGYIPGVLTVTNDNGVLTINGTQAYLDNITLKTRVLDGNNYQYLPKGSYTFDCKGSSGSYRVYVGTTYNGSYSELGTGSSATFTIDDNTNSDYKLSDGSVLVGLWVAIPANTYNDEKLYPLLTIAGDIDRTFVPYTMTNKELTEKLSIDADETQITSDNMTIEKCIIAKAGNIRACTIRAVATANISAMATVFKGFPDPLYESLDCQTSAEFVNASDNSLYPVIGRSVAGKFEVSTKNAISSGVTIRGTIIYVAK